MAFRTSVRVPWSVRDNHVVSLAATASIFDRAWHDLSEPDQVSYPFPLFVLVGMGPSHNFRHVRCICLYFTLGLLGLRGLAWGRTLAHRVCNLQIGADVACSAPCAPLVSEKAQKAVDKKPNQSLGEYGVNPASQGKRPSFQKKDVA